MNPFGGTRILLVATLRREWVRATIWVVSLVAMVVVSAQSIKGLFPDAASLRAAAASSANPAILAFNGPNQGLDTLGGEIAFQIGAPGFALTALMAVMMVGRMTRDEEQAGRLELVRSLPVGVLASPLTAMTIVTAMSLTIGALVAAALLAFGLAAAGSFAYGIGFAEVGIVYGAITLLTAQLSESGRLAKGLAGVVLGVTFILRAVGDITNGAASWASAIGWVQKARPFAGEMWWPLYLPLIATSLIVALAFRLQARRDIDASLVATRPGPATARPSLSGPFALALRLQRVSLLSWTAGIVVGGLSYGGLTNAMKKFVEDNPKLAEFIAVATGGSLTENYLATSAKVLAMIACGFVLQSVWLFRSEEADDRAEPALSTAVSRGRYWLGFASPMLMGAVATLVAGGLALGIASSAVTGEWSYLVQSVGETLGYLPVLALFGAISLLIVGIYPSATPAIWGVFGIAAVISMFGPVLHLSKWVMRISPFENVAAYPAVSPSVVSLAVMAVLAALAAGAGRRAFTLRDIPA